jgi:hypothetical protein
MIKILVLDCSCKVFTICPYRLFLE